MRFLLVGSSCFQAIMQYAFPPLPPLSWSTSSIGMSGVEFEVEGAAGMAGLEVKRSKNLKTSMSVSSGRGIA